MVTKAHPPTLSWVFQKARVEETITWFGKRMAKEMEENSYKGGWDQERPQELLEHLRAEVEELAEALRYSTNPQEVLSEAADVANLAMMIADRTRAIWRMKEVH